MTLPRKLSCHPKSPHYDPDALKRVDKVFVDDKRLPNCRAYDMDEGWACNIIDGVWQPKIHGVIRVTSR